MTKLSSRLAPILLTSALAVLPCAQASSTNSPGPYYATPSWDQQLPSATRFVVLSNWANQAVLDRETGLVWQMTLTAPAAYDQASYACMASVAGGRMGWRVPTTQELLRTLSSGMGVSSSGIYAALVIADSPFPFLSNYATPYTLWASNRSNLSEWPQWAITLQEDRRLNAAMWKSNLPNAAWCVQSPASGPTLQ